MTHDELRQTFNERADEYRVARPPYPDRVYDILGEYCGLGPGSQVLEIGAGTGLATRGLLERGADVVAVEPGAELAAHLAADLGSDHLRIVENDFETAVLPADSYDIAVSATAFHWVQRDVALPKLARVLRPGGWLCVWWTVFGDPTRPTAFRYAFDPIVKHYLPDGYHPPDEIPEHLRTEIWAERLEQGGLFDPVQAEMIRWEYELTADRVRRLFGSFSQVNRLPDDQRSAYLDALANLIDERFGGVVADPYVTVVYLTRVRD